MPAEITPRSRLALWSCRGCLTLVAFGALVVADGSRKTQNAIAQGETRTLTLVHNHTKESATITFKRWGSYDYSALEQLNWLMRDWRRDEKTRMNPKLFDLVWEAHRESGSSSPIYINSAYRSPDTNSMLRRRSRAVSKHSQHMNGNALDFFVADVSMARIREVAMRMQRGGVGYYSSANTGFVHVDVGSVRSWPRMTRDQLARLFPDERTVHLPSGGGVMAGYEEAKAMIIARGGSVGGYGGDEEIEGWSGGLGFFAALFGGGRGRGGGGGGSSPSGVDDAGVHSFALNNGRTGEVAVAQASPDRRSLRRPGAPQPEAQVASVAPTAAPTGFSLFSNPTPVQTAQVQVPAPAPVTAAPIQIASAANQPLARAPQAPVFAELPMPPRRPAEFARTAVASLTDIPMPPVRPTASDVVASAPSEPAPAVDALGAVIRRSGGDEREAAPPAQATAYAPLPPMRPGLRPTTIVAASASAMPTLRGADSVPTSRTRTLSAPVASSVALAPVDAILMEFRRKASIGPSAGHFTGAAVKPMVLSAKLR
ncbi:MAG: DUF882 domain-containing protein [Beijerinckiaceae bacterium]